MPSSEPSPELVTSSRNGMANTLPFILRESTAHVYGLRFRAHTGVLHSWVISGGGRHVPHPFVREGPADPGAPRARQPDAGGGPRADAPGKPHRRFRLVR